LFLQYQYLTRDKTYVALQYDENMIPEPADVNNYFVALHNFFKKLQNRLLFVTQKRRILADFGLFQD